MASIGHVAVGMAAARVENGARVPALASLALWSAVSLLPDLDVIGFSFGVRYADPWGHRGATHSLLFSAFLGLVSAVVARRFNRPPLRTAVLTTLVLASHAVLDTMTDGGLGCALFWPFDLTRYFAPWRPIPVAPIGLDFLSPAGAAIAVTELLLFAPLIAYAVWPPGRRVRQVGGACGLALWAGSTWLVVSVDPAREAVVGMIVREDTAYSRGYSERRFRAIVRGDSQADVIGRLGSPVRQIWFYPPERQPDLRAADAAASEFGGECLTAIFEDGALTSAQAGGPCATRGIERGMSPQRVEQLLGIPAESCWSYTWSPRNRHYRVRVVCFVGGRVDEIVRHWE
jgi:inner membrane protein